MNNVGTNYTEREYKELLSDPAVQVLSEAEALVLINKNFGFEVSRTEIHTDAIVADFGEKELHGAPVWAPTRIYTRKPLYVAPDYNYIRFDVCGNQYELCNGELYFYID